MLRSIFFLQALIAISWLLNVHCSTEVQHSVEISRFPKHLNEDDFKIIENVESWIVVFHVEWCGHCKHLLPLLEKIANSPDHEQGIKIGLVNCSESPQLCERYSVKSYPTMLYHIPLISPKWEKYFGLRSEAGLKNFFRKVGQVSSLQVLKIENLPTKPVNPRGVVFAFNNLDKVALEAIRASLSLDEADFAVIEQRNSTESSDPNYVTLISDVFDGKNLVRKHQEPWDSQAIHEFIVRNKVRTFEKSSAANFGSVLMRPLNYLIILVVSTTMKLEDTNVVVEAARNLAVDLRDDEEFSFTYVDGDIWPSFLEVFKIKVPLFPFIIAYHPRFEGYVFNSTFTSDVLHPAVKHGDSKRITAILKSAVEDLRSGKEPLIPLNFGAWLSSYARPLTGQIIDVVRASIQSETMFIAFFFVTSILFLGAIVLIIIIIFLLIKRGSSRGKSKMSNKDKKKN